MSQISEAYKRWKEHCERVQKATYINTEDEIDVREKRIKRAKKDYEYLVEYYFPHYATDKCGDFQIKAAKAVLNDPQYFGVWEWPREHAKSVHADIILPIWLWINGELEGMVLVGKNETDAAGLLSDIQAEFESNQRLAQDFGKQQKKGNWEDGEFEIADGILFKAYGRGQSARGLRNRAKRPNYLVSDDLDDDEIVNNLARVEKVVDWLLGSVYGALDIRKSRFVMVGNRIHPQSILAHIVGDTGPEKTKRTGLHHSKVTATIDGTLTGEPTWHQKYSTQDLQQRFQRMGFFLANREYFHKPIIKGKIFKHEWVNWGRIPSLTSMDNVVIYFDPSYKAKTTNDYKAIKCWANKGIRLFNWEAFVKQCSITEAVKWMYDLYERMPSNLAASWYMEEVFLQDMFFEDFEAEARLRGYFLPIQGDTRKKPDKFARIQAIAPLWERGLVTYDIRQKKNSHMQTGIDQLLGFQKGASIHDDAPDADEGAIHKLQHAARHQEWNGSIGKRKHRQHW